MFQKSLLITRNRLGNVLITPQSKVIQRLSLQSYVRMSRKVLTVLTEKLLVNKSGEGWTRNMGTKDLLVESIWSCFP